MKNKQHEYILKAYLKSKIPTVIKQNEANLVLLDSVIGGYCTQLLDNEKNFKIQSNQIINKEEKTIFSKLINNTIGIEKEEIIIYYHLIILVESILIKYNK